MQKGGNTFKIDSSFIDRLAGKYARNADNYDKLMQKRLKLATDMVWRIAHAKRPMITVAQMKKEKRTIRVSDPNATAGVPVRSGKLQASVRQEVFRSGSRRFIGRVWASGEAGYAIFIEYGTSKMRARPFIRPAINLTKDAIKRMFGLKVDSNA